MTSQEDVRDLIQLMNLYIEYGATRTSNTEMIETTIKNMLEDDPSILKLKIRPTPSNWNSSSTPPLIHVFNALLKYFDISMVRFIVDKVRREDYYPDLVILDRTDNSANMNPFHYALSFRGFDKLLILWNYIRTDVRTRKILLTMLDLRGKAPVHYMFERFFFLNNRRRDDPAIEQAYTSERLLIENAFRDSDLFNEFIDKSIEAFEEQNSSAVNQIRRVGLENLRKMKYIAERLDRGGIPYLKYQMSITVSFYEELRFPTTRSLTSELTAARQTYKNSDREIKKHDIVKMGDWLHTIVSISPIWIYLYSHKTKAKNTYGNTKDFRDELTFVREGTIYKNSGLEVRLGDQIIYNDRKPVAIIAIRSRTEIILEGNKMVPLEKVVFKKRGLLYASGREGIYLGDKVKVDGKGGVFEIGRFFNLTDKKVELMRKGMKAFHESVSKIRLVKHFVAMYKISGLEIQKGDNVWFDDSGIEAIVLEVFHTMCNIQFYPDDQLEEIRIPWDMTKLRLLNREVMDADNNWIQTGDTIVLPDDISDREHTVKSIYDISGQMNNFVLKVKPKVYVDGTYLEYIDPKVVQVVLKRKIHARLGKWYSMNDFVDDRLINPKAMLILRDKSGFKVPTLFEPPITLQSLTSRKLLVSLQDEFRKYGVLRKYQPIGSFKTDEELQMAFRNYQARFEDSYGCDTFDNTANRKYPIKVCIEIENDISIYDKDGDGLLHVFCADEFKHLMKTDNTTNMDGEEYYANPLNRREIWGIAYLTDTEVRQQEQLMAKLAKKRKPIPKSLSQKDTITKMRIKQLRDLINKKEPLSKGKREMTKDEIAQGEDIESLKQLVPEWKKKLDKLEKSLEDKDVIIEILTAQLNELNSELAAALKAVNEIQANRYVYPEGASEEDKEKIDNAWQQTYLRLSLSGEDLQRLNIEGVNPIEALKERLKAEIKKKEERDKSTGTSNVKRLKL